MPSKPQLILITAPFGPIPAGTVHWAKLSSASALVSYPNHTDSPVLERPDQDDFYVHHSLYKPFNRPVPLDHRNMKVYDLTNKGQAIDVNYKQGTFTTRDLNTWPINDNQIIYRSRTRPNPFKHCDNCGGSGQQVIVPKQHWSACPICMDLPQFTLDEDTNRTVPTGPKSNTNKVLALQLEKINQALSPFISDEEPEYANSKWTVPQKAEFVAECYGSLQERHNEVMSQRVDPQELTFEFGYNTLKQADQLTLIDTKTQKIIHTVLVHPSPEAHRTRVADAFSHMPPTVGKAAVDGADLAGLAEREALEESELFGSDRLRPDAFKKYDDGKPRTDLIPPQPLLEVARVYTYGADKYGADNWRNAPSLRRYLAAAQRHVLAFQDGEDLDDESGLHHLAHAACNMLIMMTLLEHKPESDDR
jgi:hypothetical protein